MSQLIKLLFTLFSWIFTIVTFPLVLLYGLIRLLMGKPFLPPVKQYPTDEELELRTGTVGDKSAVKANLDKLSKDEQQEFLEAALQTSDFPMFEGHVKHGYDSQTVSSLDRCPRCHSAIRQMYGNFVYATQRGMCVMLAPAGYFCQKCPTVIVDQSIVEESVSRGFKFHGVLGSVTRTPTNLSRIRPGTAKRPYTCWMNTTMPN